MSSLEEALATLSPEDGGWAIDAPEAWAQGRTLYGGMTTALAYRAAADAFPDLPPLRSAQATFVGPAAGHLRFRPTLLRRGRSSAIVAVDCDNADGPAARLTFSHGAPRESAVAHERVTAPAVPPPAECRPLHHGSRPLPGFLARFEFRQAAGARLLSGAADPEFAVWVRLRDGDAADPTATLLAVADALPCAAMVSFPKPGVISTLSWAIDLHRAPAAAEWRLLWSSSESAADGYSLQAMRLFDADGRVVATGRQVVAIFV